MPGPQAWFSAFHNIKLGGTQLQSHHSRGGGKRVRSSQSFSATHPVQGQRPTWGTQDSVSQGSRGWSEKPFKIKEQAATWWCVNRPFNAFTSDVQFALHHDILLASFPKVDQFHLRWRKSSPSEESHCQDPQPLSLLWSCGDANRPGTYTRGCNRQL